MNLSEHMLLGFNIGCADALEEEVDETGWMLDMYGKEYSWSVTSKSLLRSVDTRLSGLFDMILRRARFDITILPLGGHRNEYTQNRLFDEGKSKLRWPDSMHNRMPSLAIDASPYPVNWNDMDRWAQFAGYIKGYGFHNGVDLRCGIDWDGNMDPSDNWIDAAHFELIID